MKTTHIDIYTIWGSSTPQADLVYNGARLQAGRTLDDALAAAHKQGFTHYTLAGEPNAKPIPADASAGANVWTTIERSDRMYVMHGTFYVATVNDGRAEASAELTARWIAQVPQMLAQVPQMLAIVQALTTGEFTKAKALAEEVHKRLAE